MTILIAVAAGYLLICILAFVFQSRLVFFPERDMAATPAAYDDVYFDTDDGVRLNGWFVPAADGSEHVLLFFHGNAGNISHRLESIGIFLRLGLSVFIIDYRGYGRSGGQVGEKGTYRDARAALRYLSEERGVPPGHIIYFGRSLGSAVAIELATHEPPRALIVESSFTSTTDVGARFYRWLPVRLLSRIRYDSTSRVPDIRCPKLFIHSPDDEVIPYDLGRKLFELAAEPKTFLDIQGDHNAGFYDSRVDYMKVVGDFLATLD